MKQLPGTRRTGSAEAPTKSEQVPLALLSALTAHDLMLGRVQLGELLLYRGSLAHLGGRQHVADLQEQRVARRLQFQAELGFLLHQRLQRCLGRARGKQRRVDLGVNGAELLPHRPRLRVGCLRELLHRRLLCVVEAKVAQHPHIAAPVPAALDRLGAELAALDETDKATAVTKLTNHLKTVA